MESGGNSGNLCMNNIIMGYGESSNGGGGELSPMNMMTHTSNALYPLLPHTTQNHIIPTTVGGGGGGGGGGMSEVQHKNHHHHHNHEDCGGTSSSSSSSIKAKIMAHPHYPRLLAAYVNCQKVGAPPEVVARLEEACASEAAAIGRAAGGYLGEDSALDQFMEAYCEMLTKYEQELTKPFKEAMIFLSRIEFQFKALTLSSTDSCNAINRCLFLAVFFYSARYHYL
ncbi:hypothetical protein Nepgr_007115 [Nepenthes gracilis]|uniref:Uncharacterized protein n=1 Tax=Nepenthes gracilis TaxID=150966 RepID=A0AAD3S6D2_NEPGR|nr:hypothetical protein Nepgr_007115 [Nepenthes gracilis]